MPICFAGEIERLAPDVDSIVLSQVNDIAGESLEAFVSRSTQSRTGFERVRSMLEAMP
jgi:hypothetical protein